MEILHLPIKQRVKGDSHYARSIPKKEGELNTGQEQPSQPTHNGPHMKQEASFDIEIERLAAHPEPITPE